MLVIINRLKTTEEQYYCLLKVGKLETNNLSISFLVGQRVVETINCWEIVLKNHIFKSKEEIFNLFDLHNIEI